MSSTAVPRALDQDLCWLLSRASYTLQTRMAAGFEGLGVSPRAQMVLGAAQDAELTQSELAKLVGLDKTTMVVTVDELERLGLAVRKPSPSDRRARIIAVTDAGRAKIREAEAIADGIKAAVLDHLAEDEREAFMQALAKLVCGPLAEATQCLAAPRRRAPKP